MGRVKVCDRERKVLEVLLRAEAPVPAEDVGAEARDRAAIEALEDVGAVERLVSLRLTTYGRWMLVTGLRRPLPVGRNLALALGVVLSMGAVLLALWRVWPSWAGAVGVCAAVDCAFRAGWSVRKWR